MKYILDGSIIYSPALPNMCGLICSGDTLYSWNIANGDVKAVSMRRPDGSWTHEDDAVLFAAGAPDGN